MNDKKTMKNAGFCFSAQGMVYWKRKISQPGGKKEKRKHENEIWHRGLWFPRQYRGRRMGEGPAVRLRAGGRLGTQRREWTDAVSRSQKRKGRCVGEVLCGTDGNLEETVPEKA